MEKVPPILISVGDVAISTVLNGLGRIPVGGTRGLTAKSFLVIRRGR